MILSLLILLLSLTCQEVVGWGSVEQILSCDSTLSSDLLPEKLNMARSRPGSQWSSSFYRSCAEADIPPTLTPLPISISCRNASTPAVCTWDPEDVSASTFDVVLISPADLDGGRFYTNLKQDKIFLMVEMTGGEVRLRWSGVDPLPYVIRRSADPQAARGDLIGGWPEAILSVGELGCEYVDLTDPPGAGTSGSVFFYQVQ